MHDEQRIDLELEERFGVRIVEAHGMTEVGITVHTDYPERKLGAAGAPRPIGKWRCSTNTTARFPRARRASWSSAPESPA